MESRDVNGDDSSPLFDEGSEARSTLVNGLG